MHNRQSLCRGALSEATLLQLDVYFVAYADSDHNGDVRELFKGS